MEKKVEKVEDNDLKLFEEYLLGKRNTLEVLLDEAKKRILEDFNSKKIELFEKAKKSGQSKDQLVS